MHIEHLEQADGSTRQRAGTVFLKAEGVRHTFFYWASRRVKHILTAPGIEEDANGTAVLKLYEQQEVVKVLFQHCGVQPKCIDSRQARSMSRRPREYRVFSVPRPPPWSSSRP